MARWKARLMSYDMFCKLMDAAMDDDHDPSGTLVAPTYKTDVEALATRDLEGCTFEPEVNERSRQVGQVRGRDGSRPIHEVLHAEKLRYQETRLNAIQKQNKEVFKECTFQPKFVSKQSSDSSSGSSIYPLTRQYFREQEEAAQRAAVAAAAPGGDSRRAINFDDPNLTFRRSVHGDNSAPGAANPESPHRYFIIICVCVCVCVFFFFFFYATRILSVAYLCIFSSFSLSFFL